MLKVDTINHPHRAGSNKIARHDLDVGIGHGCIRQSLRKSGLNIEAYFTCCFFHALEYHIVGNTPPVSKLASMATQAQLFFNLWSRTVYHHHPNTQRSEQGNVLHRFLQFSGLNQLAGKGNDKHLTLEGMYIGRNRTKPGDKLRLFMKFGRIRGG